MVYYHVNYPDNLSLTLLDTYWAEGWYRMQHFIFTTDVINKNDYLLPVFWLRHRVDLYKPTLSHKKNLSANRTYRVEINPFVNTDEIEELYHLYSQSIDFDVSPSLQDSLFGEATNSIYKTCCITVRDGNKLIAAGIFDDGDNSIAGIHNFYHPDYSGKSLGKFLMLQKMKYAQQQEKKFYYTGYMSTAFNKFDYKLFLGHSCTEVYNRPENIWVPWTEVSTPILLSWLGLKEKNGKDDIAVLEKDME